jgi:hypothetical protein
MMKPMPKSPLRPGIALAVLVAGHIFASVFMRNLGAGIGEIADPWAAKIAKIFYSAFTFTVGHLAPFMAVFILFVIYRIWRGKDIQWGIDILGALLTVRCFVIFVLLNLLLLSQLRAGGLLLMQLILFLPVITLNFGWLYWRLDTGARMKGQRYISSQRRVSSSIKSSRSLPATQASCFGATFSCRSSAFSCSGKRGNPR